MKSTVFAVCEPPTMDLTPAAEYGQIEVLLTHSQSLLAPVPTIRKLKDKLRNFSDNDFLLPVGDPVLMSTVAMIAGEANNGRVSFLKWDRIQKRYLVIKVDTSGKSQ